MINMKIREYLPEDSVVFDDASYNNSIIGVSVDDRVVYDYDKMVEEYMNDNNCTYDDAVDWIEFNTIRALPYAGENAPIIIYKINDEDLI